MTDNKKHAEPAALNNEDEIELVVNKPLGIIDGRTVVHIEVYRQRIASLSQLLTLGGMLMVYMNILT